jgi:hypothetical protein
MPFSVLLFGLSVCMSVCLFLFIWPNSLGVDNRLAPSPLGIGYLFLLKNTHLSPFCLVLVLHKKHYVTD